MPSRRQCLRSTAALIGLAGCLGDGAPGESPGNGDPTDQPATGTPTVSPSASRPAASPVCSQPRTPTVPDASDDAIAPEPYPEKPAELDADAVESYVGEFERAYVTNRAIRTNEDLRAVQFVSFGVWDVRAVERGFTAKAGGHVATRTGAGTVTLHGDRKYTAAYFVSDRAVLRSQTSAGETPPDPREEGTVVQCSP